ncbi:MAG: hypothetical protein Q8K82_00965 [Gemmatimonadaceae bacterium]|nr:hypothetical protein [Gemmatimonadaceae bacterium]
MARLPGGGSAAGRAYARTAETEETTYGGVLSHVTVEWRKTWTGVRARLWFSRRLTEDLHEHLLAASGSATFAGVWACEAIKHKLWKKVCDAAVAIAVGDFAHNIGEAHKRKRCLTLDYWFPGALLRGGRWDDRGGKHCKSGRTALRGYSGPHDPTP